MADELQLPRSIVNDKQRRLRAILVSRGHIHRDPALRVYLLLVRFQGRVFAIEDLAVRQLHHELKLPPFRVALVRQIRVDPIRRPDLERAIALLAWILKIAFSGVQGGKAGKGKEDSFHHGVFGE